MFQKIKELWPAAVLCALLLALGCWLTGSWYWKGSKYVLLLLLPLFVTAVIWCYYFDAGALLATDTMLAIMQTNSGERRDYFGGGEGGGLYYGLAEQPGALRQLGHAHHHDRGGGRAAVLAEQQRGRDGFDQCF